MTLGEKLAAAQGRPSGFDYLRLSLSLGVFTWHVVPTTYGISGLVAAFQNHIVYTFVVWILPAFFALSGFLVASSLERSKTIAGFLYLRIIRIFPALIVDITVAALILGPLMTSLPLGKYLHDPEFHRYFLNCIGNIHYSLPGVFLHNPLPNMVNNQLWTIPCELKCYIIIAIIGIVGLAHDRRLLLTAVFVLLAYSLFQQFWHQHQNEARWQNDDSSELVMCFLFGVLIYRFRDVLPHSKAAGIAAFIIACAIFLLPNGRAITPPLVAYVVAVFGLTNPRKIGLFALGADYSYGIYLYSTPLQQMVAQFKFLHHNGWINFAVALPLVVMVAAFSWHFWEKPWLEMRHFRPRVDKWFSFTGPGKVVRHLYRLAAPTKA